MVNFNYKYAEFKLEETKIIYVLEELVDSYDKSIRTLNFIFCSDEELLEVNKQFLNHDYYTDIISFEDNNETEIGGDIFISIDRVKENAILHKVDFKNELYRVISHGVLHFIGFKDKTKEEQSEMRAAENTALLLF